MSRSFAIQPLFRGEGAEGRDAVCCSMLQCVAVFFGGEVEDWVVADLLNVLNLQLCTGCYVSSVLQCVAVCCSVLQSFPFCFFISLALSTRFVGLFCRSNLMYIGLFSMSLLSI